MDSEKQIEIAKHIAQSIPTGTITVLTGKNGSGKSLVRKLLSNYLAEKLNTDVIDAFN